MQRRRWSEQDHATVLEESSTSSNRQQRRPDVHRNSVDMWHDISYKYQSKNCNFCAAVYKTEREKVMVKILQGSVVTQTTLGGLTTGTCTYPPGSSCNFLRWICAKNYENWLAVDKVTAKKSRLTFCGPPCSVLLMTCSVTRREETEGKCDVISLPPWTSNVTSDANFFCARRISGLAWIKSIHQSMKYVWQHFI